MAKDPATLWYWSDWFSGTTTLTRHLKGCYMDLLHAQFNAGHLSLEEIKTVLGSDFGSSWPTIQKKFIKDDNGLFFNVRAEQEKIKRIEYTQGRKKNLEKKPHMGDHMSLHMGFDMDAHMDNVNKDIKGSKGKGTGKPLETKNFNQRPTVDFKIELSEMDIGVCQQIVKYASGINLTIDEVQSQFMAFKLTTFNGDKFYESEAKIIDHFKNWLKIQNISNGKSKPYIKPIGQNKTVFDRP